MNLVLNPVWPEAFKSPSQEARVVTEEWAASNLYCPSCESDEIRIAPPNTRAIDFACPQCDHRFQLKSSKILSETRIVDAGYEAMISAIRDDVRPCLFVLNYTHQWAVQNLLLIPRMFRTESVIQKRKPLGKDARRAGWIGCNILLSGIPSDGKLWVVRGGLVIDKAAVRGQYRRIQPLGDLEVRARGWTLDVLKFIRQLNRRTFSLHDIYASELELSRLHPGNRNIRPKIRQQLQVLRDMGLVQFTARGRYSLIGLDSETH
jgi:type II restriction enzyme